MPTKVVEVHDGVIPLADSASNLIEARRDYHRAIMRSPGHKSNPHKSLYPVTADEAKHAALTDRASNNLAAAEDAWKKDGSPSLKEEIIEFNNITIQNAIDKMEATGCEFINMVLKKKEVGAYLFFKCPAGGAGSSGGARTRHNKKSRRSHTRKN